MRTLRFLPSYNAATILLVTALATQAHGQPVECRDRGPLAGTTAIATDELRIAEVDFAGPPPGGFDPEPLLATTITTSRPTTCLVAHFSAVPRPTDNHIVFQVRVDGEPMEGHVPDLLGFGTPAVSDPNRTEEEFVDVPRMVSYTFFKEVTRGGHTVEVLFAGCCSGTTGETVTFVDSATLTLQH